MLPVLKIGPLAIQFPGLILLAGLWIGLELTERQARHFEMVGAKLYNLALVMLGAALIGGRVVFAAQFPQFFNTNPLNFLSLSPSLFSIPGGLIAGIVAGLAFGQRYRLPVLRTLDALTTSLAVMMVAVALSNLASGEAYGRITSLPWAVELVGANRHPSQAYEAFAAAIIVLMLWPARWNRLHEWCQPRKGGRFWVFLALSAGLRLFLEIFRGDSQVILDGLRLAQLISWALLAISLWQINRLFLLPSAIPTVDPSGSSNPSGLQLRNAAETHPPEDNAHGEANTDQPQ